MTLEQLRIFVAVAEQQHVTRAAKFLNLTQSTVSAAVLALEQRHGVALFDRVGRSIILNQTGRVLLERARRVLAEARAAEAALDDLAGLRRGELSMMASLTIAAYWLPRRLAAFHTRYPRITFDVRIGNTEAVANATEAGLVEIGLVEGKVDRAVVSSTAIATDEMIVVASPTHGLARMKRLNGTHLKEAAWVLREPGSGTRLAFETLAAEMHLKTGDLDVVMTLPSNEAVLGAVEAGVGLTLTSRGAANAELSAGLLVELPFPSLPRPFFLLRHKQRFRSKVGDAFEDLLRTERA
ncbi:LysR family transcriptional regulator [Rhizobium gallicum]|uniref:LysR family transcriptional regulator n=1 Tax=Rhizobium gallicum TaxID=56730 RepID=UPI001EF96490|nr:LysR family transcriptional regulator [Rhizobium gallicum]ULJ75799.1 LysR family transcriptional regulator [Rhizobium gallicum]